MGQYPPRHQSQYPCQDSKSAIAEWLGRLTKIHFIGDGYFEGSKTEKAREYAQALFGLELRSICAVDEYIYWFRKYFFQNGVATEVAAPMFFAKICSPWREMLIQSYKVPEGQLDSVARRMSFLKDKLKDWCYQASIQKNMKRLRGTIKRTPLCCDNNDFPTIIGESSEPRKRKKQNNDSYPGSSRRTSFRRRSWWSKSKARTYKSGQRTGPTRASSQGSRRTDNRSTGRTPTEELSGGPIPEPTKVLKTAIAGLAEQRVTYLQTAHRNVVNYANSKP
ncbi:UNVERIFIED_CONTAM: hypothetical protein Slati_0833100 [Sesamum latifolium]|uniref:Uncharacterized protein n=1 Tax=Sesamum latifolium TaxID=2727402 RepID=A0AAW2XLB4_9LAMI